MKKKLMKRKRRKPDRGNAPKKVYGSKPHQPTPYKRPSTKRQAIEDL